MALVDGLTRPVIARCCLSRLRWDRRTQDYIRRCIAEGKSTLDVLTGTVIGKCFDRHRHDEFLRFLRTIDTSVPRSLQIYLIVDNYGTHNDPNVKAWLAKHPRFHLHFTATSSSWLNLVERWFVGELVAAIEDYLLAQ